MSNQFQSATDIGTINAAHLRALADAINGSVTSMRWDADSSRDYGERPTITLRFNVDPASFNAALNALSQEPEL